MKKKKVDKRRGSCINCLIRLLKESTRPAEFVINSLLKDTGLDNSSIYIDKLVITTTKQNNTANYSNDNNKHVYAHEKKLKERIERVTKYTPEKELELMLKLRKLKERPDFLEFT